MALGLVPTGVGAAGINLDLQDRDKNKDVKLLLQQRHRISKSPKSCPHLTGAPGET